MFIRFAVLAVLIRTINCKFICTDSKEIPKDKICDGTIDCSDASDESKNLCVHIQCDKNHFRCRYGGCVPKSLRCDQKADCMDGSDEYNCGLTKSCNYNDFHCSNDKCITLNLTCDNRNDCDDNSDEDAAFCEQPTCGIHQFKCKSGGCVDASTVCDGFLDCFDGSDEEKYFCHQSEILDTFKCPGLTSRSLHITCQDPTKDQQLCEVDQAVGTAVHAECKEYYEAVSAVQNSSSYCQLDGRWNSRLLKCKPICGVNEHIQPLIANGYLTENWPWYAALYSSETGDFRFFCGGTLISEYVVISAAHCTWRKSSAEIQAVFGKHFTDLSVDEEHAQKINVSKFIMHPNYYDIDTNYGSDISVLFLEQPVVLTQFVRPACIDWTQSLMPKTPQKDEVVGMVVGMGITENDTFSDRLRGTKLPIVTTDECIKNQRRDFHKYISLTSFCAGWMNGTGVCNGDSGGGLLVQGKDRWYLEGIVSISPRKKGMAICDAKRYTIFTKVSIYLDWIKNVVPPTML